MIRGTITDFVLGIDFGTTNSCVCYYQNGLYNLIPNENGNYITKSCIYFNPNSDEILYGDIAYKCKDNINNFKRLLGVKYEDFKKDQSLCYFFKHLHIVADKDDTLQIENEVSIRQGRLCKIVLQYNNRLHEFSIEYIIGLYITHLLKRTREFLNIQNEKINAVITVPVLFTNIQRTMLKSIFELCNINVVRIINEPTAAILPYVINNNESDNTAKSNIENILVIDCGGGTTDFTVIECDHSDTFFEVKYTTGDNFLGGEDITDNMYNYIISKYNFSNKNHQKIRKQCEIAKCLLSYQQNATIYIEDNDTNQQECTAISISRSKFININNDFFKKIRDCIINTTTFIDIDRIVFVGGTTRIPYFSQLCKDIFNTDIIIEKTINQDHVVSMGAALQAYLLTDRERQDNLNVTLLDVLPISLGVETDGGIMTPIISRNSLIPISKTETFTNADCENLIDINIYQGERKFVKDNLFLGTFSIPTRLDDNREWSKRNSIYISITFDINSDGILIVTSKNKQNENVTIEKSVVIDQYIKSKPNVGDKYNLDDYVYNDDYDKIKDSELANKILAKIELNYKYEMYKRIHGDNCDGELLYKLKHMINNFQNYTTEELTNLTF
jgi:molecular chaperone DnaK (HSP70)